jgi:hypothetical protein
LKDLHSILKHLEVQDVDLIIFEYVFSFPAADGTDLFDNQAIAEGLLGILTKTLIDVLFNLSWVEKQVLGHFLMIEVGKFLELFNGKGRLLFVISVREEPDGFLVLVTHYVKDTALLRVGKVNFLLVFVIVLGF